MNVPLETWVRAGTLMTVAVGLYGALSAPIRRMRVELKGDIAGLDGKITGLRSVQRPRAL